MKAIEALGGLMQRTGKFRFNDQVFNCIQCAGKRKGEVSKIELSRWKGVVGSVEVKTVRVKPADDVEVLT